MATQQVDYDNKSQMERIAKGLLPDETLFAVYDMKGGGTGFIGLTNRRIIVQDEGIVRKRRSLTSIPYRSISMISSEDEGGFLRSTSSLTLIADSREFDFDFRSGDKAQRAYQIIVQHMS